MSILGTLFTVRHLTGLSYNSCGTSTDGYYFCSLSFRTFWPHSEDEDTATVCGVLQARHSQTFNLTLSVPWIILRCVDKATRYNTSYEWSLFATIWLYMFRTVTSSSSGASSHKVYNALVHSCYQASLAATCASRCFTYASLTFLSWLSTILGDTLCKCCFSCYIHTFSLRACVSDKL